MKNELDKYLEIVQDFVNRELPVEEFERNYLKIVKNDQYLFPDYVHREYLVSYNAKRALGYI